MKIYYNGQKLSIDTREIGNYIAMTNTTSPVFIGASGINDPNDDYGIGKIDDVRLYSRELSAGEILKLYNMGK